MGQAAELDDKPKTETKAEKTPKRKHRVLKAVLGVFAFLLLGVVLFAGWLGLVPGLSLIMGSNTAKDLGVHYTDADFSSYQAKTSAVFIDFSEAPDNPAKPGKKAVFAVPKTTTDMTLTDQEITAALNSINWAWMPLNNPQVKFSDGSLEASGTINMAHITDFVHFIGGVGYDDAAVQKAVDYGKKTVGNAPIYIKAAASVENDTLTLQLQEVKIGRFTVPKDIANKVLRTGTTNAIVKADNFEAKKVTFTNGELHFSGTYPSKVYVKHPD